MIKTIQYIIVFFSDWISNTKSYLSELTLFTSPYFYISATLFIAYVFLNCIQFTARGAHQNSKLLFTGLLISAPLFIFSTFNFSQPLFAIGFLLVSIRWGLEAAEKRKLSAAMIAVVTITGTIILNPECALLMLPLLVWSFWRCSQKYLTTILLALPVSLLLFAVWGLILSRQEWALVNYLNSSNGPDCCKIPNFIFTLLVVAHPRLFFGLPLLTLIVKKTDLLHVEKKALFIGLILHTLWLNGLPNLTPTHLLPGWVIILLLAFPAWDRFIMYGFYFAKKTAIAILVTILIVQLLAICFLNPW